MAGAVRRDIERFAPNIVHVSSPDPLGQAAVAFARKRGLPAVASVHTRFETYTRYYGFAFMEPVIEALMRRFYPRLAALVAPSESLALVLSELRRSYNVGILSRGIDQTIFHPARH